MYYKICEECGAVLDPGEKCDCETRETFSQDQDTPTKKESEVKA